MNIEFKTIDIERDFEFCVQARKDAYVCSFHREEGFEAFILGYREKMAARMGLSEWRYIHIWNDDEIIGQLEFRSQTPEPEIGYVHLIYIVPTWRGTGLSDKIQHYIQSSLKHSGCHRAMLSVSRTNPRALRHYLRHGWSYQEPNPKHAETDFYCIDLETQ